MGFFYLIFSIIELTTLGSNNVEVSPKSEKFPSAIFLSILRIILPDLVLGRPETNCILSGFAMGPISTLTVSKISLINNSSEIEFFSKII